MPPADGKVGGEVGRGGAACRWEGGCGQEVLRFWSLVCHLLAPLLFSLDRKEGGSIHRGALPFSLLLPCLWLLLMLGTPPAADCGPGHRTVHEAVLSTILPEGRPSRQNPSGGGERTGVAAAAGTHRAEVRRCPAGNIALGLGAAQSWGDTRVKSALIVCCVVCVSLAWRWSDISAPTPPPCIA